MTAMGNRYANMRVYGNSRYGQQVSDKQVIITCDAIGLWADWDHYGNKFLTFSVDILCLVRIILYSS